MDIAKRWRSREQRWVSPGNVFSPAGYSVDVVSERLAKPWVVAHHYSGSYPAARLAVGLWRGTTLAGVAVLSVPMNQRVVPLHTGVAANDGAELGRFVCDPLVGYNGESWLLRRVWGFAREAGIVAVVSYADPLERTTSGGIVVKPQHWGTIYQASNATYVGVATARWLCLAPDGNVVSERMLSKVRNMERGHDYGERQLLAWGAPPRNFGEHPAEWVRRALDAPQFRRVKHTGNHTYVFGLTDVPRKAIATRGGLPYPRKAA